MHGERWRRHREGGSPHRGGFASLRRPNRRPLPRSSRLSAKSTFRLTRILRRGGRNAPYRHFPRGTRARTVRKLRTMLFAQSLRRRCRPHLFALESHNLVTLLIVWPYFVESNRNSRLILGKAVALGLGDGVSNQIS